jgi:hypothetical protein
VVCLLPNILVLVRRFLIGGMLSADVRWAGYRSWLWFFRTVGFSVDLFTAGVLAVRNNTSQHLISETVPGPRIEPGIAAADGSVMVHMLEYHRAKVRTVTRREPGSILMHSQLVLSRHDQWFP